MKQDINIQAKLIPNNEKMGQNQESQEDERSKQNDRTHDGVGEKRTEVRVS